MSKKSDNNKSNQNQNIRVFVRCRPINSIEKKRHSPSVVSLTSDKKQVIVKEKINEKVYNKKYSFDKVFGPETEQVDVYLAVVQPLIEEVLMGYNCTVFAYGQTGTGKTYTMEGERHSSNCSWEEDPAAGIIPRSIHQLFDVLTKEKNVEFSVRVSFLELYNEELFDLLSPSEELSKLRVFEDSTKKGSVMIQGLEEIAVHSKDEVYTILEKGTSRRQTAATMMNASSSRSHTVFSVTVHIKENTVDGEELFKTGKLNLVDLAGSENIGRSGAVEKRAREAGNINQSLLTLGRVITALVEKAPHIPYRESKLTRLLQDSLGGHTKTSIIATISPAHCNADETNSTLDYAHRAKNITNKPEVNQRMTKHAIIKEYTEEIERLRRDLAATREKRGICLDPETYKAMQNEMIIQVEELKELQEQVRALEEQKAKMEKLFSSAKEELQSRRAELDEQRQKGESLNKSLQNASQQLSFTQKAFCKTALERDEKDHLINAQMKTEKKLSQQTRIVLDVADKSTKDVSTLHAKIARNRAVQQKNEESAEEFKISFQQQLRRLDDMASQTALEFVESSKHLGASIVILLKYCADQQHQLSSCFGELTALQDARLNHLCYTSDADGHKIWINRIIKESDFNMKKNSVEYRKFRDEKCYVLFNKVQHIIDNMKSAIPKIQKSVLEKLMHHENAVEKFWNEQKTQVAKLSEYHSAFIKKQDERLKCCAEKTTTISTEYVDFYKEMNARIHSFQLACDSVVALSKKQKEKMAVVYGEINKELGCSLSNATDTSNEIGKYIANMNNLTKGFVESSVAFSQDATNFFEDKINSVHALATNLGETLSEIQSEVSSFWSTKEQEQKAAHEMLKNEIQTHSMTADAKFQDQLTFIGEMRSEMEVKQKDQEHEREVNKKEFEKHSNDQLDLLHEVSVKSNQLVKTLKNEVLQTDLALEKFLTDDLQKDIPTGETPERKNYIYPKTLTCTSPHERILERFRLQRESGSNAVFLPPDESFEYKDKCQVPANEEKDSSCYASDDSCASESAQSSDRSMVNKSYRGKENWQNSDNKSARPHHQIPVKKTYSKKARVQRKPFKNALNK